MAESGHFAINSVADEVTKLAHDLRQLHGGREFPGITDREVEQLAPEGRFIARIFASDYLTSDEFYAERQKKRQEAKKYAEQRNAGKLPDEG